MNTLSNSSHTDAGPQPLARLLMLGAVLLPLLALVGAFVVWASGGGDADEPIGMTHRIARGSLVVSVSEQGLLESEENTEIKSMVRGRNAVLWIVDSGTFVEEGDELVRLDALFIQEQVDERTKYANWSQSAADRTAASVIRARLAVEEYEQGRYRAEVMSKEKDLAIAKSSLQNAKDRLQHATVMAGSGYISELDVEEKQFAVTQAELNLELLQTQLKVLQEFTYKEQLQTLKGELAAIEANHKANVERAMADNSRRDRAVEELDYCVIKAPKSGLVIHPSAAKWETAPIAEGTNVYKDQVLLLMPDLQKMQVRIGVHETSVKRVQPGQHVAVTMADDLLDGSVSEVASIAKPAGWWTGNQVRYDTLIRLPPTDGLRPGMSAEVDITIAEYKDVLLIPVAAVVEEKDGRTFCWRQNADGAQRIQIKLGDSDDVFYIVEEGLDEGDDVLLNPAAKETPAVESSDSSDVIPDEDN